MQQTFKNLLTLFLAVMTIMAVSCEKPDGGEDLGPTSIKLNQYTLKVDGLGGEYVIGYKVTNPRKGATLKVECSAEWIERIEVKSTTIVLQIAPSDRRESREARLRISYPGSENSAAVNITQAEMVLDDFLIEVSDLTHNHFTVTWTPVDDELLYITNLIAVDYFTMSGVSTEEQFITEEFNYFMSVAQSAGLTLEQTLLQSGKATSGVVTQTYGGLAPGSRYIAYAYGVELNGDVYDITVPIHYSLVVIPMPPLVEAEFNANITVTGSEARITMTPLNWDGYYTFQVVPESSMYYVAPGDKVTPIVTQALCTTFFSQAKNSIVNGLDVETYLERNCYRGTKVSNVMLNSGRYMLAVFGVDYEEGYYPMMCTEPRIFHFTI